MDIQQKWMDRS